MLVGVGRGILEGRWEWGEGKEGEMVGEGGKNGCGEDESLQVTGEEEGGDR